MKKMALVHVLTFISFKHDTLIYAIHVENPKLRMQVNQGVLGIGTVQPAELRNSQSMSSRPFITPLLRAVNECVSIEDI